MNSNKKIPLITTERLFLRELVETDIDDLLDIFSSEEVTKYYGMFPIKDREAIHKMINSYANGFDEERLIRWGIEEKKSGKIIGTCGFHSLSNKNCRAEIGYVLSEAYWHNGFMTEAITKVIEYGFNELNLNRIEGLVYPENLSSQRSLKRFGFKQEGLLREYMYCRDVITDLLMYSLLKSDFMRE